MPNPSNSDLVGEARRLSEAATPGPWWVPSHGHGAQRIVSGDVPNKNLMHSVDVVPGAGEAVSEADAEFIARARTLLPELAQQLEQAEQELERVRGEVRTTGHHIPLCAPSACVRCDCAALTPDEGAER